MLYFLFIKILLSAVNLNSYKRSCKFQNEVQ